MSSTATESTMARRRFFWLSGSCRMGLAALPVASSSGGLSAPASPPSDGRLVLVHASEGLHEVGLQGGEVRRQRRAPRDHDVVEITARMAGRHAAHGGLEAPPDAIALDRLADLPRDGETEARSGGQLRPALPAARLALEHEGRPRPSCTLANPLKFRPLFQRHHVRAAASR